MKNKDGCEIVEQRKQELFTKEMKKGIKIENKRKEIKIHS